MKLTRWMPALAAGAVGLLAAPPHGRAADHLDSPAATAEPNADITDLYAWMNADADKVRVVLDVHPLAGDDSAFSTAVQYAVHFNSASAFGEPATETVLLCQFYDADKIECWLEDSYVEGDPSDESGIESDDGKLRVFAGLRNDPFFFELEGFNETVKTVVEAAPSLTFDEAGCPMLDEATQMALVGQLQSGMDGAAASDTLAGSNVLALVLEIDKELVTGSGPVLGVWASTHAVSK